MKTDEHIGIELESHGRSWDGLHGGYFSDPVAARPLVDTVSLCLTRSIPGILVDLGGGTGFVLSQLIARGVTSGIALVNMDYSAAQLSATCKTGITCVRGSIDSFNRGDLAPCDRRFFFVMRSVFHYFGEDGLMPVLRHVRSQARVGEMFVHQSACFHDPRAAACINALYRKMGTKKWYPMVNQLRDCMIEAEWHVVDVCSAPPLRLTSSDLGNRYGLNTAAILRIRAELVKEFGEIENVFQLLPDGFVAYLPYSIYVCTISPKMQ